MKKITIAVMLIGAVALSACSKDRYNGANGGGADGAYGAAGDPSDPRSTAYFNQTIGDRVLFAVDQSSLSGEAERERGVLRPAARDVGVLRPARLGFSFQACFHTPNTL